LKILKNLYETIFYAMTGLCVLAVAVMVLMISVGVFTRYVLSYSLRNVDEIAGYLLVIIVYFGAAYTHRKDMHIRVPVVVDELPAQIRKFFEIAMEIVALFFVLVVLVWLAYDLCLQSYQMGSIYNSSLETPMWIPQMIIPLGSSVFAIEIIRRLYIEVKKRKQKE
jgi:TRAP-type transport system small permease protein